jgi:hypothetical protein
MRMNRWGYSPTGPVVTTMHEQVRDSGTHLQIAKGPEFRVPLAFASGEPGGPAESHSGVYSGSCYDGQ